MIVLFAVTAPIVLGGALAVPVAFDAFMQWRADARYASRIACWHEARKASDDIERQIALDKACLKSKGFQS